MLGKGIEENHERIMMEKERIASDFIGSENFLGKNVGVDVTGKNAVKENTSKKVYAKNLRKNHARKKEKSKKNKNKRKREKNKNIRNFLFLSEGAQGSARGEKDATHDFVGSLDWVEIAGAAKTNGEEKAEKAGLYAGQ